MGVGRRVNNPSLKKKRLTKPLDKPRNWTDSLERPRQTNKYMRIGTWNVTSLYRAEAVTLVAREVAKYRLDLVGVPEVRLDGKGISPIGDSVIR